MGVRAEGRPRRLYDTQPCERRDRRGPRRPSRLLGGRPCGGAHATPRSGIAGVLRGGRGRPRPRWSRSSRAFARLRALAWPAGARDRRRPWHGLRAVRPRGRRGDRRRPHRGTRSTSCAGGSRSRGCEATSRWPTPSGCRSPTRRSTSSTPGASCTTRPTPSARCARCAGVLRPGGAALVMLYARRSWVALGLWARYAPAARPPMALADRCRRRAHGERRARAPTPTRAAATLFGGLQDVQLEHFVTPYDRRVRAARRRRGGRPLGWFVGIAAHGVSGPRSRRGPERVDPRCDAASPRLARDRGAAARRAAPRRAPSGASARTAAGTTPGRRPARTTSRRRARRAAGWRPPAGRRRGTRAA